MERIINANMQLPDDPDKILSNVTEILKKQTKELSKTVLKLYRNNLRLDIKKI